MGYQSFLGFPLAIDARWAMRSNLASRLPLLKQLPQYHLPLVFLAQERWSSMPQPMHFTVGGSNGLRHSGHSIIVSSFYRCPGRDLNPRRRLSPPARERPT
jgi:hypothetical protein